MEEQKVYHLWYQWVPYYFTLLYLAPSTPLPSVSVWGHCEREFKDWMYKMGEEEPDQEVVISVSSLVWFWQTRT